ncbi:MAG: DUF4923 family protein [Bacteroidales bacterium]|nr:DUF4923 family protein [Bacteroidales bacterium]
MLRKSLILSLSIICATAVCTFAQDWKSIINDIAKSAIGDNATSAQTIIGDWSYKGAASQFESENLLAQAGGAAATSKINAELEKVYSKIGFKSVKFSFNQDNTYTVTIGKITTKGTYTFDSETKKITMKTKMGITLNANVATLGSSMSLLFNADKLMDALKALTGMVSKVNSTASTITTLLNNYDGLKLGFELTK